MNDLQAERFVLGWLVGALALVFVAAYVVAIVDAAQGDWRALGMLTFVYVLWFVPMFVSWRADR